MPHDTDKQEAVHHPKHYNTHPSGVECITVVEWMNFNRGNATKYIWRAGEKGDSSEKEIEDLKKAEWYIRREIDRLEREQAKANEAKSEEDRNFPFRQSPEFFQVGSGQGVTFSETEKQWSWTGSESIPIVGNEQETVKIDNLKSDWNYLGKTPDGDVKVYVKPSQQEDESEDEYLTRLYLNQLVVEGKMTEKYPLWNGQGDCVGYRVYTSEDALFAKYYLPKLSHINDTANFRIGIVKQFKQYIRAAGKAIDLGVDLDAFLRV